VRKTTRLKRDWWFTPGTEWIVWDEPETGKIMAFRVILTDRRRFFEWQVGEGVSAGVHDDGETPGRSKASPILLPDRAMLKEVAAVVMDRIKDMRRQPAPSRPPPPVESTWWDWLPFAKKPPPQPQLRKTPPPIAVRLPDALLDFIEDQIRALAEA
jgi:hypothetical protein